MDEIKLYENKQIRSAWDDEKEEWYFSVVDVVGVLTESENPQVYWRVLKKRLKEEGNERGCEKTQLSFFASPFLYLLCIND